MTRAGIACTCALILGTLLSVPAKAVSASSDYSALWWNASESGWGMNVAQQEQILFITLFIYGPNGPTWFVAPNVAFASASAAGDRTYTGDLYRTAGTPFSVTPYNPSAITVQAVGNITFVGRADGTAAVQYVADGNSVNKTVARQTWAQPNFTLNTATSYVAAESSTTASCVHTADNGRSNSTHSQAALYINSVGATMRFELATSDAGLCIFQGNNYVQAGRYGKATLTGTCANFPANPMTLVAQEVEVGANYFTFQYTRTGGPDAGCTSTGVMMGAKK